MGASTKNRFRPGLLNVLESRVVPVQLAVGLYSRLDLSLLYSRWEEPTSEAWHRRTLTSPSSGYAASDVSLLQASPQLRVQSASRPVAVTTNAQTNAQIRKIDSNVQSYQVQLQSAFQETSTYDGRDSLTYLESYTQATSCATFEITPNGRHNIVTFSWDVRHEGAGPSTVPDGEVFAGYFYGRPGDSFWGVDKISKSNYIMVQEHDKNPFYITFVCRMTEIEDRAPGWTSQTHRSSASATLTADVRVTDVDVSIASAPSALDLSDPYTVTVAATGLDHYINAVRSGLGREPAIEYGLEFWRDSDTSSYRFTSRTGRFDLRATLPGVFRVRPYVSLDGSRLDRPISGSTTMTVQYPDVNRIVADPTIRKAIDEAWRDARLIVLRNRNKTGEVGFSVLLDSATGVYSIYGYDIKRSPLANLYKNKGASVTRSWPRESADPLSLLATGRNYVVALFHTHPNRHNYNWTSFVGPSETDLKEPINSDLPQIVQDYQQTGWVYFSERPPRYSQRKLWFSGQIPGILPRPSLRHPWCLTFYGQSRRRLGSMT